MSTTRGDGGTGDMAATKFRVRVVNGARAVLDLLAALPPAMRRTGFQHPTWADCWFAVDGRAARKTVAAVVECAETGRPLFVLPLILDTLGAAAYWAPLDFGVSDYNTSLTAPDFHPSPTEMRAIWLRIVAALPDDAAFLLIDKVPADIDDRHEPLADLPDLRRSHVIRHPLRLDTDYATLRDTRFSQSMVRSLDRKRRKLERKGDFRFEVATGAEALPALECLMTWRGERYGENPAVADFYRHLTAAGEPVRVMWLALDGTPVSACFGIVEPHAFRLLALGHDEAFKNWSPGLLVIEDAIAWASARGLAEFDFTIGSEAYKFDFGVVPEPLWLVAAEFSPHGSAMLRLLLTRNLIASKLKRYIDVNGPRRRTVKAAVA